MRVFLSLLLLSLGSAAFAANWVPLLRSGNRTELARQGGIAGASGLAVELASEDRQQVMAALHAAHGAEDAWALLGALARTSAHPDRSIAILAAQVAAELAHQIDFYTISEQEIPKEHLAQWQQAWLKLALNNQRWIDIRIYSLEVAATLHALLPREGQEQLPWEEFFASPDEEMRAAAMELAPRSQALETRAVELVKDARNARVALSAAQRLCGPLGRTDLGTRNILDEATLKKVVELAENKELAIESRVDLANCFVGNEDATIRRALAALTQESPAALRKALIALSKASSP